SLPITDHGSPITPLPEWAQQNRRQDLVENSFAILRIAADDERVTHVAAQRMLRPIRRKTQRDQWLHKYRAASVSRFHRQRAAMQTRFSSLRSRPIAARASPIPAPHRRRDFRNQVDGQIPEEQHSYHRRDQQRHV